jgi:hypothetical protein
MKKRVVVVGAGIAGMTAAHELAERGYEVEIVEMAADPNGGHEPRVGGMARTTWASAPSKPSGRKPSRLRLDRAPLPERYALADLLARLHDPASVPSIAACKDDEDLRLLVFVASRDAGDLEPVVMGLHPVLGTRFDATWIPTDVEEGFTRLEIQRTRVAAEHGFRFFPSFYRHMFDTMRRVPVQEARASDSARSVFDALCSAEGLELGLDARRSFEIPRRPLLSVQEIRALFANVLERAGYRGRDLYRLATRYLEYLTASTERRRGEYEGQSWAEYLGVNDGQYSDYFASHVTSGAQALVAMSSDRNDARTIGSIAMQLTLDQLRASRTGCTDATLRGPTSVSLFDPWATFLRSQGVRFTTGELVGFRGIGDAVYPVFRGAAIDPADYYVITIPVERFRSLFRSPVKSNVRLMTERQVREANRPWMEATLCPHGEDPDDVAKQLDFDVGDYELHPDRGPMRSMCGIQFYFEADVTALVGHTVCLDSPWGVSYLSQARYWQERPRGKGGVRGVISAIFTLWEVPAPDAEGGMKTALECDADELAARVWKQIADAWDEERRGPLPTPKHYCLDESLERVDGRWANRTPYLINQVGLWEQRGGVRTDDGDYRYELQLGHTVFAGVFMRTKTRLNSMEASNESARRAVNAILEADASDAQRCPLWDLEAFELPGLDAWRALDARIYRRGGQHVLRHAGVELQLRVTPWDLLRVALPTKGEAR